MSTSIAVHRNYQSPVPEGLGKAAAAVAPNLARILPGADKSDDVRVGVATRTLGRSAALLR